MRLSVIPKARVVFVSDEAGEAVAAGEKSKLGLVPSLSFKDPQLKPHVIVVPGGFASRHLADQNLLNWIRKTHETTLYTTSVCTGALLLGAAGLLRGLEACTHWDFKDKLEAFGAKYSTKRYIRQGKIITSAGVSAGIDMALYLASLLTSEKVAKGIQLVVEYGPEPPFNCGTVETAGPEIVAEAKRLLAYEYSDNS